MEINNKIFEIFDEFKIRKEDGICYLISLYHGYEPTYIPEDLKKRMNLTKIVVKDKNGVTWNVPLYEGVEVAFDWVRTEYIPLFKEKNSKRGGKIKESITRMKKLFATNPDIRKEEVIGATKMYLRNTHPDYIRFPHYFIEKGVGVSKTQDILDWIEKYRLFLNSDDRKSLSNIIQ